MDWRHILFRFEGRIGRGTFWLALCGLAVAAIALSYPAADLLALAGLSARWSGYAAAALVLYPACAFAVKRLHDRGRPGTWIWALIAPFALVFAGQATQLAGAWTDVYGTPVFVPGALGWALYAAAGVMALVAAFELGIREGNRGENRFGPDPQRQSTDSAN